MKISGIGCILMDYVYSGISYNDPAIKSFLSKTDGDGGIMPGKLVFTDELERYSGMKYPDIIKKITGGVKPNTMNIGGPAIVSLIHAKQLISDKAEIDFYGAIGNDETARNLLSMLARTPVSVKYLKSFNQPGPFTHVLSDPQYNNGQGERSFINNIGAAGEMTPPGQSFFDSGMVIFGGTALVPGIHDNLSKLIIRSKENNNFTIVNTVYDFRNQKKYPEKPWPLVNTPVYPEIDLLIMDKEEALKISGSNSSDAAMEFFKGNGCGGIVITAGAGDILAYASERIYKKALFSRFPVSSAVINEINKGNFLGDTTGCGDNFAGGFIASLAEQISEYPDQKPDFFEALTWAVASGGFACSYLGGTYFETSHGEKRRLLEKYRVLYEQQLTLLC
jgi:sugar/nucleoside kinase (ribokinase family)